MLHVLGRRLRGEDPQRGSLALSIMLVVIVTGLIPVVASTVMLEQRTTRADRDSGVALEAADAGIQDARYRLINRLLRPSDPMPATRNGSVNGVPFTWSARPDPASSAEAQAAGLTWLVVSRGGHPGGSQRTVRAYLSQRALFGHALFLNNNGLFDGGNRIDSFRRTPSVAWNTGFGAVGSNGNLSISGNFLADRVMVYDWTANPSGLRCTALGNSGAGGAGHCTEAPASGPTATARRLNIGPRFPLPVQVQAVSSVLADPACPQHGAWVASTVSGGGPVATFNLPAGTPLCFTSLDFDRHTVFPPSALPYQLYVSGQVRVRPQMTVNCSGCGTHPPATAPNPARLLIYTMATTGPAGTSAYYAEAQVSIAAGIYVPQGSCGGGAGNHVYGSVLCFSATNVGGWQFHYDEAMGGVAGTGEFTVSRWDESPGAALP